MAETGNWKTAKCQNQRTGIIRQIEEPENWKLENVKHDSWEIKKNGRTGDWTTVERRNQKTERIRNMTETRKWKIGKCQNKIAGRNRKWKNQKTANGQNQNMVMQKTENSGSWETGQPGKGEIRKLGDKEKGEQGTKKWETENVCVLLRVQVGVACVC